MPVKENAYALTGLARVKQHGGITGNENDAELDVLINEVSARIEGFTGRHFLSRQWVHDGTVLPRLDSHGGTELFLRESPITAVASLKTYPTATALTEGYASDFVVHADQGVIELINGHVFLKAPRVVEITYTAGYSSTLSTEAQTWLWGQDEASGDIRLAATKQVVWEFRQKQREREGIASRSEAGATVTYLTGEWLPEVAEILKRYRRMMV
jgi:hypothetical protein